MATNDEALVRYQKALCVFGYHVYKARWEVATGKTFVCMAEPGNSHDRHTMAVGKDKKVVEHLPQSVTVARFFFF